MCEELVLKNAENLTNIKFIEKGSNAVRLYMCDGAPKFHIYFSMK